MLTPAATPAECAVTDPVVSAESAGLRYVADQSAGIVRQRVGKGFRYLDPRGRAIRDAATRARIRSLAIPPAWDRVWICPFDNGHLQATGFDDRGRKQYLYHPRWREFRDAAKFDRLAEFARALPAIRRRVNRDLKQRGLPRSRVLAAVVRLLEGTLIRVGNGEYSRQNGSYGLTTMRDEHVRVTRGRIRFEFRGKAGVEHQIDLHDPRLARIVRQCQDLPGQELLAYVGEDGAVRDVTSADVNDYLRTVSGQDFTAKDFRTWSATVFAAEGLARSGGFSSQRVARQRVNEVLDRVAQQLGNTRAICRKCYVHPTIVQRYMGGTLSNTLAELGQRPARLAGLSKPEQDVLALLENDIRGRQPKRTPRKLLARRGLTAA
jgi:DNA topoisomerase-1